MKYAFTLSALSNSVLAGIIIGVVLLAAAVLSLALVIRTKKRKGNNSAILHTPAPSAVPQEPAKEEPEPEAPKADEIDEINSELDEAAKELENLSAKLDVAEEEAVDEVPVEEVVEEPVVEEAVEEVPAEEVIEEPVVEEAVEEVPVEEPVVEEAVEEVPVEEPVVEEAVEEVPVEEPVVEQPVEKVEQAPARVAPVRQTDDGKWVIRVRYNRSYTAKIIQSNDVLKNYYTEIKNELLRYGVKSRISWRHETFRLGRKLLVRLTVRGKTLSVYYALNPADYEGTKYRVLDVSAVAKNKDVPTLYKVKNDRRCRYAKQLIADLMKAHGLEAGEEQSVNYSAEYPYEETETLIDKNLIKLLPWKDFATGSEVGEIKVAEEQITEEIAAASEQACEEVYEEPEVIEEEAEEVEEIDQQPEVVEEIDVPTEEEIAEQFFKEEEAEQPAPEVDMSISLAEAEEILDDEYVESFVRQSNGYSDKTKKAIVNIDTLGRYFHKGETVTVDEIKKRVPGIGKNVTYVKVLARGTLDKALTVEADDFSPQAIKMIVLTGGTVVRKKSNRN